MSTSPTAPLPPPLNYATPTGAKTYTVGTLAYTRGQLVQVFFWLLLGDFCLHLMDNGVVPTLVPLQFEAMGASKTLYSFVAVTLVNVMYTVLTPVVSMWSDRTRTRIGRRRPFLLAATPVLAVSLVLIGFSTNIARYAQSSMPGLLGGVSTMSVALAITITLFVVFKFFDMFPQSVYYYLWPDVIPPHLLGMFGALFRVFYAGGSLVFNRYLIGLAKEHPQEIYLGSALLYMVAFLLLVWRVKEPEYPPLPPRVEDRTAGQRFVALVASYFRECFSHPFYLKYYFAMAAFQMGYQPFIANLIFFGKDVYGNTGAGLADYGRVMAGKDVLWIVIYLALVPVMARLHPVRAGLFGYVLMTLTAGCGMLFIQGPQTFKVFTILTFGAVGVYLGGTAAIGPRLLPKDRYGQFASAGAMIFRLSVAAVGTLAGLLIDRAGTRFIYAWLFGFLLLGTVLMWRLYREWQTLGGVDHFEPPDPDRRGGRIEPGAITSSPAVA